jgi:hypothetical protein
VVVASVAGCAPAATTLLVEVVDSQSVTFNALHVHVFDPYGVIATAAISPVPLPGALTVQGLSSVAQPLRVVGAGDGASPSLSGTSVASVPHGRATARLDLAVPRADSDGDGVPDLLDDCPAVADPDQRSTLGGPPGDACRGGDLAGADLTGVPAVDLAAADAASPGDGAGPPPRDLSPPPDLTGVLLFDDFLGSALDTSVWHASTGSGSYSVGGGLLTLTAPTAAGAFADISSIASFAVGTTFEARVSFSGGQTYDEKGVGYANGRLADTCSGGETEAALIRGDNANLLIEPKSGNVSQCLPLSGEASPYDAGFRVLRIVRLNPAQIDFYDGSTPMSATADVPPGPLPLRFGVFTSTANPPQAPVTLIVDWVRVTKP